MEIKKIDITKPLEAYDEVLDAVKRAGREPNTADRMLAMRAAIAAYEEDEGQQSNAIPPTRGTDSKRYSDARDASRYRWLCANNFDRQGATQVHTWVHTWEPHSQTGEPTEWKQRVRGGALDAVIDDVMGIGEAWWKK